MFFSMENSRCSYSSLRLHVQRGADELLLINLDSAGIYDQLPSSRIFSIVRNEVDIPISYIGGIASAESAVSCIKFRVLIKFI